MKRVTQTRLMREGEPPGNCFAACIASILECDIDEVPWPELEDASDWSERYWQRVAAFLESRGWALVHIPIEERDDGTRPRPWTTEDCDLSDPSRRALAILSGPGPRGRDHAVVGTVTGQMVHDPHPSGDGLLGLTTIEFLVPTTACELWRRPGSPPPHATDESERAAVEALAGAYRRQEER